MAYLLIYDPLLNHIKENYPSRVCHSVIGKSWHDNRFIQLLTPLSDENIHYEYIRGRVCLHFEEESVTTHKELIQFLMEKTENEEMFDWGEWNDGKWWKCQYLQNIETVEQLDKALSVMVGLFDGLINEFLKGTNSNSSSFIEQKEYVTSPNVTVELYEFKLEEILQLPLSIPDYQRIYCWEQEQVMLLLNDITTHLEADSLQLVPYRLGTIILHYHDQNFDIIDGQQRLVTLALLLEEMGIGSHLLDEKIASREAYDYVAYNKYLIQMYLQKHRSKMNNKILQLLDFNVLILQNTSLDLAYTFFSNENSRGVELSDYDLLKAHHLRFIPQMAESQSRKVAEVWNSMIERGRANATKEATADYERTLDTYIYCLRRWMRQNDCETDKRTRYLKREFEAAPIIDEIPPFGERFYFNEPIQGGVHFFSFVEQHLMIYQHFVATPEYAILHSTLSYGSDAWYRDVIEAILFGYYAKFGEICLADALVVTLCAIAQHRYENKRARKLAIMRYIGIQRFALMIDHATSPTFFLAEMRNVVRNYPVVFLQDMSPVQKRMKQAARKINKELEHRIVIESFKTLNK